MTPVFCRGTASRPMGRSRDVSYQEQEDGSKLELPYIRAEYADWGEE